MNAFNMTREQWVELFEATGLDEAMMDRWHSEFERRYPAQHESFLHWIGLSDDEIRAVRSHSQTT